MALGFLFVLIMFLNSFHLQEMSFALVLKFNVKNVCILLQDIR